MSARQDIREAPSRASAISGLQPEPLWRNFQKLADLPRPSKAEEKVLAMLKQFADDRGLTWKQDAVGNMVIYRKGSGGGENAPAVLIQGHVDMVCEKNADTAHDFFKDPIRLVRDGDWIRADGTTLGADNGIGVAAAMALLELPPTVKLPPLECLFTVDEETGLTGAYALDASLISARTMLNLDTEEWGSIYVGCAGGGDNEISLAVDREPAPAAAAPLRVAVRGLLGGHSGVDIHEDRANAVVLTARVVRDLQAHLAQGGGGGLRVSEVRGGDKHNAIPRECTALVYVPADRIKECEEVVTRIGEIIRVEYGTREPGLAVSAAAAAAAADGADGTVLREESAARLLDLIELVPHGVLKMSHVVPGLVETSNNLASVRPDGPSRFAVVASTRSSHAAALEHVRRRIATAVRVCGGVVKQEPAYPGWAPDPSSRVVQLVKRTLQGMTGSEPQLRAIHAGLECGILGEKVPGLDIVSFGPSIFGAHSPDERLQISTVEPFWNLVLRVCEQLADVPPADGPRPAAVK